MATRSVKVAVIGAGVSGLAAARELQSEGHIVVVFEKSHRIGGTWVYDPKTESDPVGIDPNREVVHGSAYLSLRTNLPRPLMGFLDYPFTKREGGDQRAFPGHEEVLRFLEELAGEFGLLGLTRLNTEVVRVQGRRNDEWLVESRTRGGDSVSQEVFEAVVVCSGHYTQPKPADIPGLQTWRGNQMHCHNYRVPQPFEGQVVILIGLGPSSLDISKDIAPVAKEVHIAIRPSPDFMGFKFDNFDNISFHSTIKSVDEDGLVAFEDGFSVHADAIIHCTGYRYKFPFLETNGVVSVEDNRVGPLYKHVFPPALAPWLSFIGLTFKDPVFHVIELQAKWVARVLSGKIVLPAEDEMMESVQDYYQWMQQNGLPKRYTHSLRPYQIDYKHWLVAQIGLPPLEDWRENMYRESIKNLLQMKSNSKDQWDDVYWDSIIQGAPAS